MEGKPLRVVQWATGNIGRRSMRAVIESADMALVGVYVYSDEKAGRDAGVLCGVGPIGVSATRSLDEILALAADCVLYMGDRPNIDVLCSILESGANVVTTRTEFNRPASMDPLTRDRVEQACRAGQTTLHSTGSSPGFITEALPLALVSLQRRIDLVTIEEFADMSSRDSPEMLFDLMGFGRDAATFDASGMAAYGGITYGASLGVVADALSLPFDDVVSTGEVAVTPVGFEIAAGRVEAGTIAAQRMEVTGLHKGEPLLRFRSNWYLAAEVEPAWELRATGWHVLVEGDMPLDVDMRFPVPPDQWPDTSPGLTAHRAVNAVPYVCSARPGIATTADLPYIVPQLGPSQ